jgi:hypothetical protein
VIDTGVPLKYRWWNVPGMPPRRKIAVEAAARVRACGARGRGGEEEGERRRREDLEEAFDPQVHDPPAPVLGDHGEVRACAVEQAGAVEEADGDGESPKKSADEAAPLGAAPSQRRPERRAASGRATSEAAEERDLPDAAEVDVFVALVAEPEPWRRGRAAAGDREATHR